MTAFEMAYPLLDELVAGSADHVEPWMVHKRSFSEVLLRTWSATGPDTMSAAGEWPSRHPFFGAAGSGIDSFLVAETFRQCAILYHSVVLNISPEDPLIFQSLKVSITSDTQLVTDPDGSVPIEITLKCRRVTHRENEFAVLLTQAGRQIATGLGVAYCLNRSVYARARSGRVTPPLPSHCPASTILPSAVGRRSPGDVAIAPANHPSAFLLRADLNHPTFFDHPSDHVPGMVLMEAARQAATMLVHPTLRLRKFEIDFLRFLELTEPTLIYVVTFVAAGSVSARLTAEQDGSAGFRATFNYERQL